MESKIQENAANPRSTRQVRPSSEDGVRDGVEPSAQPSTVLLVEDDFHNGTTVRDYLKAKGYEVRWARDGAEAVAEFRAGGIDLCLLDVTIPELDGYEVCRIIKSECGEKFIPVLFVTARSAIADKIAGFDAEGDGYVTKPYDLTVLYSEIRALMRAKQHHDQLIAERSNFERLSLMDPLTGLYNRRVFVERLGYELARSQRYDQHLSLCVIDIDHFKAANDTHGHLVGDSLLKEIADLLRADLREVDLLARYGGEEFVCILPCTPAAGAQVIAERLRAKVESHPFAGAPVFELGPRDGFVAGTGGPLQVTISVGVTSVEGRTTSPDDFLGEADRALYAAKSQGRNRVCVHAIPARRPGSAH